MSVNHYISNLLRIEVFLLFSGSLFLSAAACNKDSPAEEKHRESRICPGAEIGWQVSGSSSGLKKAGISTRPAGYSEALMTVIPDKVHKWVRSCKEQNKWKCVAPTVLWFQVGEEGEVKTAESLVQCPAADCLLTLVSEGRIPKGIVPDSARICLYLILSKN